MSEAITPIVLSGITCFFGGYVIGCLRECRYVRECRYARILIRILSKEGLHTPAVNISVTMNEVNGTKTTEELIEFLEREMER